jgi:cob(I)alamin adenosyltransferase
VFVKIYPQTPSFHKEGEKNMTIVTRSGDDGKSRWNNQVVGKDSPLLEALGTLDELQSIIDDEKIQRDLYEIMGEVGYGTKIKNLKSKVKNLEEEINNLEKKLEPIREFLIFKNEKARRLNWVRTICRRCERRLVSLNKVQEIDKNILIYLNRLSDYLFMLARKEE